MTSSEKCGHLRGKGLRYLGNSNCSRSDIYVLYEVICGVQEVSLRSVVMRRCWRRGHVPFRRAFVWILLLWF